MAKFMTSYVAQLAPEMASKFNPPSNAWYAEVPLEKRTHPFTYMKRIIGTEGKAMKAITHQARVSYMWYFPEKHVVGIWAVCNNSEVANARIEDAKHRLQEREKFILTNYSSQASQEYIDAYINEIFQEDN